MLEMINDGKDLREEKPNPRTLSQGRKPGTPATSQGKKIHVQPSRDGHRRTDTSWQAEQVSLNHHILILHLHLVKLLSTPFVFFCLYHLRHKNLHRFITQDSFLLNFLP